MIEQDIKTYIKTQLGDSLVDVEVKDKDLKILTKMALDKLAPYYEGHRFVQASGNVIDLSEHKPIAIEKVYNVKNDQIVSLQDYAFGGTGVIIYDTSFTNRIISYQAYKMFWDELQYQKGINFKFINNILYLDGYQDTVLIDMLVRPKVISDIDDNSQYCPWIKEYVLALTKEMLGRIRGKFSVDGSPYTLDSAQLLSEAQSEKTNLESQLIGEIFVV